MSSCTALAAAHSGIGAQSVDDPGIVYRADLLVGALKVGTTCHYPHLLQGEKDSPSALITSQRLAISNFNSELVQAGTFAFHLSPSAS
jgi:hypothetical protein